MPKRLLTSGLLLASLTANAAPYLTSDPYPTALNPKPTLCVVYIDAAVGIDSPVLGGPTAPRCSYDLAAAVAGNHSARAKFAYVDATYGRQESDYSNTVNFTVPAPPSAPAVRLSPTP